MRSTTKNGFLYKNRRLVSIISVVVMAQGAVVNAQEVSVEQTTQPVASESLSTTTQTPATEPITSESQSTSQSNLDTFSSIEGPGFVIPESSENGAIGTFIGVFWKIVNAVGAVFLKGPLSSELLSSTPAPATDPRGELSFAPAEIDFAGKIADPAWFTKSTVLKNANAQYISAYSASMERDIPLILVRAPDNSTPRPVLYALSGVGGGETGSFVIRTDLLQKAHDLNLNVVMPAQGANSNYLDWYDDSGIAEGKQQWETFLTKELPGPLEAAIGANGQRSIVGMSMSGGSVFILAAHKPGFYDAVGGISGCGESNNVLARTLQQTVLQDLGTSEQLYGPVGGSYNRYNDALEVADRLASTPYIYSFNAGGLLGAQDFDPEYSPKTKTSWLARVVEGSVIEWATGACNHRLEAKLQSSGIPATFEYSTSGAHSWGVFNQGTVGFMDLLAEKVYPQASW